MITIKKSDKYSIHEYKIFYYIKYNKEDNELPDEGWKIHISATYKNYQKILNLSSNILIKNKVNFKWIKNEKIFYKSIIKTSNRIFSGKFITIYPKNTEQFYFLLEELYEILKKEEGSSITTDRQYKDCKVLYYRYGGFTKKSKLYCKNPFYEQPSYVEDKLQKSFCDDNNLLLNNKYEIIDILHISNGGGVLLCKNIKNNKKYIIKEAREWIYFYKEKTVIDLRKNEKEKLILLSKISGIPKYVEDFYFDGSYFLVEEYIENSVTLLEYFENNNILKIDIMDIGKLKIISQNILDKILKIKNLIKQVNDKGYLLEDISPVNFIISNEQVYFIDLELCTDIKNHNLIYKRKENKYLSKKISNFIHRDEIKVGIMLLDLITKYNKNFSKIKNKGLWVDILWYITKVYNLPYEIYKNILYLISNNNKILKNKYNEYLQNKIQNIIKYKPKNKIINLKNNLNSKKILENLFFVTDNINFELNENLSNLIFKLEKEYKFKRKNIRDIFYLIIFARVNRKGYNFEMIDLKKEYENYKKRYMDEFMIKYNNKYLPYIIGNSGLIIYEIEEKGIITEEVQKYLKGIETNYCNKINFEFGMSGLMYTYLKLYSITHNEYYLEMSKKLYSLLNIYLSYPNVIKKLKEEKYELFRGLEGIEYSINNFLKVMGDKYE